MKLGSEGVVQDLLLSIQGCDIHNVFHAATRTLPSMVLEVGCGSGKLGLHYANKGSRVIMIDPDPDMREYAGNLRDALQSLARASWSEVQIMADVRDGDARDLRPMKDASFDFVFNEGLIEHWSHEDQLRILREMSRVSSKWVALIFPDASVKENWEVHAHIDSNYHGLGDRHEEPLGPDHWRRLFHEAGLRIVAESPVMRRMMAVVAVKNGAV